MLRRLLTPAAKRRVSASAPIHSPLKQAVTPVTMDASAIPVKLGDMLDVFLVPANTVVTAKGDSDALEVKSPSAVTLLVTLTISRVVEQEAIELSVFTSSDGTTWETKPLASLAQKFYPGDYPLLVDLSQLPNAKFVRVHWEVNRWGRGPTTPNFEIGVRVREVPREVLVEAMAEGRR